MRTGRPTTYKPEYCDMLIDHMSKGFSFESFAAITDTCFDTLYEWAKVHPEFSEAKKNATAKSMLQWEKFGMAGMLGQKDKDGVKVVGDFNATVWIFSMKNKFGWKDKQEISLQDQPITIVYNKDANKSSKASI